MVKYIVRFNTEGRELLVVFVNTGRAAAATLLHTRILLKADVGAGDRHWTDAEIAEAVETSATMVHRVRQTWVEPGLEAALAHKRPPDRIATWTGPRRPSCSLWPIVLPWKAGCGGP